MKLLIDTNIILEILLEQENQEQSRSLLEQVDRHDFYITDFAIHSIGVLTFRQKRYEIFHLFLDDVLNRGGFVVLSLSDAEIQGVVDYARQFALDFDDAYQYTIAEKYGLTIVSFDSDFDRTPLGRKTPAAIAAT